jgi:SAM-dependent methyltransferase
VTTGTPDLSGDELAKIYGERFSGAEMESKRHLWKALYEGFFAKYVRRSDTVLDLAAGSCEFINACDAASKIAVDLNPETKNWADRETRVVQAPSTNIAQVDDESVDVVFTSNFFEHLPDKRALLDTLGECHRVLRPDGRILVLMPNLRYVGARYWDYFDHHLPLTHMSLVEGLNLAGFTPDRVIPRFVPYTVKNSPLKIRQFMVRAYLRVPLAWRFLGGQMFVAAHKTEPREMAATRREH